MTTHPTETITIVKAAIRAARHKVGRVELPILLLSRDGVTSDQIAHILSVDKITAKGRISMLLQKRLVHRLDQRNPSTVATYVPTERGMGIIRDILGKDS